MSGDKQEKRAWFGRVLGKQREARTVVRDTESLAGIRALIEGWQSDYADGVTPDRSRLATARVDALDVALTDWRKGNQVLDEAALNEFEELSDQAKICRARIALSGKKPAPKELPKPALLAFSWCEKNIDKGPLLDALKKTLPAFEKAVAVLQKEPSPTALNDAVSKLALLSKVVGTGQAHYAKRENGGADSPKGRQWDTLAVLAQRQSIVLTGLSGRMADFDPVRAGVAAKKTVTDGRGARAQAAIDRRAAALKVVQDTLDEDERAVQSDTLRRNAEAKSKYDNAMLTAGDDLEAQAKAKRLYETALKITEGNVTQREQMRKAMAQTSTAQPEADFAVESALANLSWAECSKIIPASSSLFKALKSALPAYEKARAAFEAGPTAATHQAALDALWTLQKDVQKALAKADAEVLTLPTPEAQTLTLVCKALPTLLRSEATLLQQAESELPQTRMAKAVMESDPTGGTLDAWVAELGGQAKTPADKARVRAALKAKYGLDTLEGDMSTKALPRLFDVLGRVPMSQTGGNESLKMVVRSRSDFVPSGFYDGDEAKMQLDVGRTGRTGLAKALFGTALPFVEKPPGGWKGSGLSKPKTSDVFDHLTLHEIGHSVDDKMGFMDKRMGNGAYGGWKRSSPTEVRDIAFGALGFGAAYPDLSDDFKKGYLAKLLAKEDPSAGAPTDVRIDWTAMANHPGALFCKGARLGDGAITEVTQWDKKAKDAVHGGRVYQQAYDSDSDWYSYDLSARGRGIGGYQFRAPGEWFSEIYACYYGGRLQSSHADYAWMQALVDTDA